MLERDLTRSETAMSVTIAAPRRVQAALGAVIGAMIGVGFAQAAPASQAHPNLSGFWAPMSDPMKAHGRPAFTPLAIELQKPPAPGTPEAKLAANGVDISNINCLALQQPWTLVQSAPIDLIQDDKELVILYEKRSPPIHIYMDGRAHPDMATYKPTLQGHSIGHWEGDTLVIDTVGFADKPGRAPLARNLPHTPTLHVVYRFHLENKGEELHGLFTIEDPKLLTAPFVYEFTWHREASETSYADVSLCDPRNPANGHY
jgi:hypothetical protein